MGEVNCYLLQACEGFALIDTGAPNSREALCAGLRRLGCQPGALKLIILTHGDFDHAGNAAHVRAAFGGKIAMHPCDAPMVENGDMYVSRGTRQHLLGALVPWILGFGRSERFAPDILLEDGSTLLGSGLRATVIGVPGHSRGSMGILTTDGQFFCGDLFDSTKRPTVNSHHDRDASIQSAARLRSLGIRTVLPGHGESFSGEQLPA